MEKNQDSETFRYTYSAKQQEEINKIRDKYITPEEDKMEQLRRLDQSVTKKAGMAALTAGIIGALILGLGMSFAMTDLGEVFGSYRIGLIVGIIVGGIGIVLVSCAYPIYNRAIRREREKIAPEILSLTDELMR
mgnify:CR=1 FL=1